MITEISSPPPVPSWAESAGSANAAAGVAVENVSKSFGSFVAVTPTSFDVPAGALVTLVGPSGSGKTTVLKIIAGFEEPSSGRVLISGLDVTRTPPHKRSFGFIFQQYALFPHLTVGQNVAYPLKMRRVSRAEIRARVADALSLVRLNELEDRYPAQLSGGQQQRVALARAIVFRPPLLLMDEPLSALDKRLREDMQYEIRRLQRQLGITTIAVTHDQTEALVMSDMIIVLNRGTIEQRGSPKDVYTRPCSEFVANFLGESNVLRGIVRRDRGEFSLVCANEVRLPLSPADGMEDGMALLYVIRPESIVIGSDPRGDAVNLTGRVLEAIFSGDSVRAQIDIGLPSTSVVTKILTKQDCPAPRPGDVVPVSWSGADATTILG
jgi:spermidine/putrescine ABC transporter ATP-binding subunit